MNIGVLSVQGAFAEHIKMLDMLHVSSFEIRKKSDLKRSINGLIFPGGESTTMGKLLLDLDMMNTLRDYINSGMPVFGTCAGMILLANCIINSPVKHLGTLDISVQRNASGRQIGSYRTISTFGVKKQIPMTFIRAPYIESVGEGVYILSVINGNIVAVEHQSQLATSFHPELTEDTTVHQHFLEIIKRNTSSLLF